MTKHRPVRRKCDICQKEFAAVDVMPAAMIRPAVTELIQGEHPAWSPDRFICFGDLNRYRTLYVAGALGRERGELSDLETDVVRSLEEQELLSENVNEQFEGDQSIGARLSDHLASFGGSWTFLMFFATFMADLDRDQFDTGYPEAVRSLSLYSAQPDTVVPGRDSGSCHHDEPKPARSERPNSRRTRLPHQSESRVGNPPRACQARHVVDPPMATPVGNPGDSNGANAGVR